jgi:hypothetical protein
MDQYWSWLQSAIKQLHSEILEKEMIGQSKVVLWDNTKDNPPEQLKSHPVQ